MLSLVRGIAIAVVLGGLFATMHPQATHTTQLTVAPSNSIPVPVCPPNDPNACHIDQW